MSMAIASLLGATNIVTSFSCRASSGGTRRDHEKILARQQKRRVRHMKGVTPSTPDLIKTLDSEKRDQAKLDREDHNDNLVLDEPAVVNEEIEVEDGGATK